MNSKKRILILLFILGVALGSIYFFDPFGKRHEQQEERFYSTANHLDIERVNHAPHQSSPRISGISVSSDDNVSENPDDLDEKWCDVFLYDPDIREIKEIANYVLEHSEVKKIILPISFSLAGQLPVRLHGADEGKSARDVEYIGSSQEYLEKYPDLQSNRHPELKAFELSRMDAFFKDLSDVLGVFRERQVEYKVLMYPLYQTHYQAYDQQEVRHFLKELAQLTDFYDFTYTDISFEPRYFYDTGYYRKDVGDMMKRKIFEAEGYIPEDFGAFIQKGSAYAISEPKRAQNFEHKIKVLILHHIDDDVTSSVVITEERLKELFDTIRRRDYQVIRMRDIEDFVKCGKDLPEKSVLLTFDDGYLSNYTKLFPLLREYQYSAVFFPIGVLIGKTEYKDTRMAIIPHYSMEQIKTMISSGLVEFGSHGYDIHQSAKLEKGRARESILKFDNESEAEYVEFLTDDFNRFRQIFAGIDLQIKAMAYPLGRHDTLSDLITVQEGIELSFTTKTGDTSLLKGLRQSMLNMNRINIDMHVDLNKIFE